LLSRPSWSPVTDNTAEKRVPPTIITAGDAIRLNESRQVHRRY
jgi:hypothetical protein